MKWILLMMMLTMALEEGDTTSPVMYIRAPNPVRDFWMVSGKAQPDTATFITVKGPSLCFCRNACLVHPQCHSVTAVQLPAEGNISECHLSEEGPHAITLEDNNLATYLFWKESIPSDFHGDMPDGFIYLLPITSKKVQPNAKNYCAKIPGYRLAMMKTEEQYQSVLDVQKTRVHDKQFWVDLLDQSGNQVWGDGTELTYSPVINAGAGEYFMLRAGSLVQQSDTKVTNMLCQADPLNPINF